jgi:hypothetical protein
VTNHEQVSRPLTGNINVDFNWLLESSVNGHLGYWLTKYSFVA